MGEVQNLSGVHGIAIAHDLGRGFISNGKTSTVTIFDLKTLAPLGEVKMTGENPDAILYDPFSSRVFAFNGRTEQRHGARREDRARSWARSSSAASPSSPPRTSKGRIFVNVEDKSEVVAFGARDLTVKAHWPLKPCEEPSGMAIDRKHHRLLIGCDNKMAAVMDTEDGQGGHHASRSAKGWTPTPSTPRPASASARTATAR